MADLDTLRPEVREAVACMDSCATIKPACGDGFLDETWCTIRAELLRLADVEAELEGERLDSRFWKERAVAKDGELAALKARIAECPVVACAKTLVHAGNTTQTEILEYTHERVPGGGNSWNGKRVRLLVEE